jgi:prophage DNA circulation protein
MTWRTRIKQQSHGGRANQGSFRGVPFIVPEAEGTFGRRTELHEYPKRDKPYVEDLGRKAREFSLTVFVDGSLAADGDYLTARDQLIAKLEEAGPGALIHPYYGSRRVSLTEPAKVSDSSREGGRATFTLVFVESGDLEFPVSDTSTAIGVQILADAAEGSVLSDFAALFSVDGLPNFHLAEIEAELARSLAGLETIVGDVAGTIAAEIRAPYNMGGAIIGALNRLATIVTEPLRAFQLYESLFDVGNDSPAVPLTTPARQQQARSTQALHLIMQRAAVVNAARASSSADHASLDDALNVRERLLAAIDTQMETTDVVSGASIADDVFQALGGLRAAVAEDLLIRGGKLPRITRYTPLAMLPMLVIAHRLYGDASRADEIVARNKVRHPGFVPGGQALEVLNG